MKLKKHILPFLLIIILSVAGCGKIALPSNANAAFEHFTLSIFQQDVASTTLGLHYTLQDPEAYGIKHDNITLGEFVTDSAATLASLENLQASLNKFSYNSLSEKNRLTYDVLSSYIETAKAGASYLLYEEPLSPVTGIHAQLPVLLAEYALQNKTHVETYLELLKTTPAYFDSLAAFEQAKAKEGLFMSNAVLDEVLAQCNAFLDMGESNYLLSTFAERVNVLADLSSSEKTDYIVQNRQIVDDYVLPAYRQLISTLSALRSTGKNAQGMCYLAGGKEYFAHLVARETGSSRSLSEIQTLIEAQIAEDILEIQKVASENPELLQETAATSNASPTSILESLKTQISDTFPEAPEVNVEVKYVPQDLEAHLSPAFYLIPSIDNTQENVIYINPAHSMEGIYLFTTLAHEGYPGHLYQTTYYAATNPDPLRTIFNFKGYVEGWATYAEMCSYYLSPLEKPYAILLQKNSSLILGLYAMADLGIHEQGWNLERTMQFFQTYGIEDETAIAEIYELILGDPANYLSYYVGYLEMLELKKDYIAQKGDNFSQKEFHKEVLEVGPAPFDVVRKEVLGK